PRSNKSRLTSNKCSLGIPNADRGFLSTQFESNILHGWSPFLAPLSACDCEGWVNINTSLGTGPAISLCGSVVSRGLLATGAPERYVLGLSGRRGLQLAEAKATEAKVKKGWPRRAKAGGKKACTMAECKRPYRAKGYCFFHFKKWRQGDLPHTRYRVCSKPECRPRTGRGGRGEKNYDETTKAPPVA